jgi:hypothetical protein
MSEDNLKTVASIDLSAGHLLVVWDILANRLSGSTIVNVLTEEERMAIWAMEDICEEKLKEIGFSSRPQPDWEALMANARAHVRTLPVEFLG